LRERGDDLPVLCEYFIGEYVPEAKRNVTGVSPQVMDLFRNYSWPGNIRELENVIRRGVFKGRSEEIRLEDLPLGFAQNAAPIKLGNHDELLQEYSRQLFVGALKEADGNRTKARKLLGLPRTRFWRLAKRHGLDGEPGDGGSQHDAETEDADWL
jgi:DNA-binding NtrC family response regulator